MYSIWKKGISSTKREGVILEENNEIVKGNRIGLLEDRIGVREMQDK